MYIQRINQRQFACFTQPELHTLHKAASIQALDREMEGRNVRIEDIIYDHAQMEEIANAVGDRKQQHYARHHPSPSRTRKGKYSFHTSESASMTDIRNTYGSNRVDLVVSTHPDNDHVSGLHVVLEELEVGELWMHRPWNMSASIKKLAEETACRCCVGLSSNQLRKSLEAAYDLEKLAVKRGVSRILDPFQGEVNFENTIYVLGPSRSYYQSLVLEFEKGGTVSSGLIKLKKMISEVWHKEGGENRVDN